MVVEVRGPWIAIEFGALSVCREMNLYYSGAMASMLR